MPGFLSRLAQLFSVKPNVEELEDEAAPAPLEPDTLRHVDSNADTLGWFSGGHLAQRDSIDSDPGTARWYRRPRYIAPQSAAHRTSVVGGGQ